MLGAVGIECKCIYYPTPTTNAAGGVVVVLDGGKGSSSTRHTGDQILAWTELCSGIVLCLVSQAVFWLIVLACSLCFHYYCRIYSLGEFPG